MLICTLIYLITKPLIISQNVLKGCRLLKRCVSTHLVGLCADVFLKECVSHFYSCRRRRGSSLSPWSRCYSKNKGSVALRGSSCWLEKRMILQILTKTVSQWRLKGAVMECKWVGQAAARGQDPSERSYSEWGFTQLTGRQKHWLERNNNLWIACFSTFISQPRTRQVQ